ncbi:chemotaxis protein CheW [Thermoanaerobacterium thermosaccharolyticum]|jgi:purine-binding chemotaxis protein CheW|uniref:CheW protein n=3 Tax=Thermoanaerobacterium thermosaccharolyticum TaxID=1517 RepID=D9TML6_THETC|nr:chemotaxis protein CheW [Thermoanaerobacterium thermosaccharolyticum]TCW38668.1 purine-binding chemotaxis protein CheW [Thermohydrogenium kirishiense]ADL68945.1 CheW protein [Thermoanaerobacterium thermosaccharolyticum DSM 571]AGB19038.1 chemotaxis signal transduction protein [Thermoanaerobacterium thermosaccharolyticum M0795]AST59013.1 chemotaxis protein [Thermoanaerobacterium thermosaccharolyticum]KAA5807752.1 chemotaxis protein CheW [Thermoanaerobacterium thermosaccharolyticum]
MSMFVVTRLGSEEYGIEIDKVQSIEKVTKITRVPKAPSFVKGVINLRGEIIPVISLRMLLKLCEVEFDDDTRIVIIKNNDIVIGIIVDNANEVVEIHDDNIDSIDVNSNLYKKESFIGKIGKIGNRILMLFDIDKLTTQQEVKL